jgi:hypothetical protein
VEAKRKGGLNPSLSSAAGLMPGRKPSAKGTKRLANTDAVAKAKEKSA